MPKKRTFRFSCALYLPERIASMPNGFKLIQRTDLSQARQFFP